MYEEYYGFQEKPFSLLPDPGFLYLSRQHSMAYAMLEYGILNQSPITVVTGDIGAGKTTLIRHLLTKLTDDTTVGLVSNTHESFGDVLQWVLLAYDLRPESDDKAGRFRCFTDFMISEYAAGRKVVLIIDEAQNMTVEALEEVRLLSNINADKDQLLQLILVGQPELREKLKQPMLKQFVQRVAVAYHLTPLTQEDTKGYIRHRLETAGGNPDLFDDEALAALHEAAGGVPRLLNTLADTSLVYAYASQAEEVSAEVVDEVVKDRLTTGIFSEP